MRKQFIIISMLSILFFQNCTFHFVNGRYVNTQNEVSNEEIIYKQQPNKFEYYLKSEMGILNYSTGNWIQNKNKVILNGFTDDNIESLDVAYKESIDAKQDKIFIKYALSSSFIKADVIINDNNVIRVSGDTILGLTKELKTIQIKSYLSHEGILLSSAPHIDTLYSIKIHFDDISSKHEIVTLKFSIFEYDFNRIKLTDTVIIKNNRTLMWRNKRLLKK